MSRASHAVFALLAFSALAGCRADRGSTSNGVVPPPDTTAAVIETARDTAAPADSASGRTDRWAVSVDGVAELRIGMEIVELMPYLAHDTDTIGVRGGCRYVAVTGAPDSMDFMVESGRLARIDVRGGTTPTVDGARIGDETRRIEALYPGLRRMPHKYVAGEYLVVIPAPADTLRRYVFETDGTHVTRYRAGLYPQVEWVEGCA